MENPIKMGWFGGTTILENLHIWMYHLGRSAHLGRSTTWTGPPRSTRFRTPGSSQHIGGRPCSLIESTFSPKAKTTLSFQPTGFLLGCSLQRLFGVWYVFRVDFFGKSFSGFVLFWGGFGWRLSERWRLVFMNSKGNFTPWGSLEVRENTLCSAERPMCNFFVI